MGVRTEAQGLVDGGSLGRDKKTGTGAGTREGVLKSGLDMSHLRGS